VPGVLEGSVVGGRYRIRQLLGAGGSASIYEGEDLTFGRTVAVKIPHDTVGPDSVAAKRLVREARASGAVGHPNVCEVSELGTLPNGTPFVVMERLVGETLRERMHEGRLAFGDIVDIMLQVLSGLGAAHERGIVHRDIKPENIFLVRRAGCPALVKLLDFGLVTTDVPSTRNETVAAATVRENRPPPRPQRDREELTATGMVVGTPYYLAPEQLRGIRDFDARVDLYACGVVLYEMTTGRKPFRSSEVAELFKEILSASPPTVLSLRPETPPVLAQVIERAMSVAPAARFATAGAFQTALGQIRVDRPTASPLAPFRAATAAGADASLGAAAKAGARTDEPTRVEGRFPKPPSVLPKPLPPSPRPIDPVIDVSEDDEWEQETEWDQPTLKKRLHDT
jgi:eukaryotic-like serine/threonine-protein kinase